MRPIHPILAGVIFISSAAAAAPPPPPYGQLRDAADEAVVHNGLPSVVVVLFDERQILWSHVAGYADVAHKRRPTLGTRYRLGSTAKAVTSTITAIAEQKRLMSFDASVPVNGADGPIRIPLRKLVNMEAGLAQAVCYEGISGNADPDCGRTFAKTFTLAITGGDGRYSYSNMGPQAAADALSERLSEPFERIARRLLFLPAGMGSATFDHARAGAAATDYERDGKPFEHDFQIQPEAGAGLETSAQDLVRFGQLHLTGRAPNGRQLLSQPRLAELHSAPNGSFYGYGWGRIGAGKPTEVLIADGQVNGGQAMLILSPRRRLGAIVLSNAAHDEVSELAIKAIDALAPGTARAFAAELEVMQSAHEAKVAAFLPPQDFSGAGFVMVGRARFPLSAVSQKGRLKLTLAGQTSEQPESTIEEGFRGWSIPCPGQVPACRRPGATAKIWLSLDAGGLSGQLQVTSLNGQLPYVRVQLH